MIAKITALWFDDAVSETQPLNDAIAAAIARAPEWLRADLLSKDASTRLAAEEAMAAMVRAAIGSAAAAD